MSAAEEILTGYADAAALIIAAVDDREALDATLKSLTFRDAAKLLISALEVGASLVTIGDRTGQPARDVLTNLIAASRDVQNGGNV